MEDCSNGKKLEGESRKDYFNQGGRILSCPRIEPERMI